MFIIENENEFLLVGSKATNTTNKLDKGVYNLLIESTGPMSPPRTIFQKTDIYKNGVVLDTGVFKDARDFINNFFDDSLVEARKAMNMKNKVGVMFSGDPGTGKTFLAGQLAQEISDKYDAIAIIVTAVGDYSSMIDAIREADKDRSIVIIIDEFEKTFRSYDPEPLAFLDGSKSRENCMVIATVNNHKDLPTFVTDRPSRFEKIFKFEFGDKKVLTAIINNLIPEDYKSKIEVDNLVYQLIDQNNKSIDKIKHIIRDVIASYIRQDKTGIKEDIVINIQDDTSIKKVIGFSSQSNCTITLENDASKILEETEFIFN